MLAQEKEKKLLSIVIPVHDSQDYTRECIEAIYQCTRDYEVVVVDNGSREPVPFGGKIIRNEENLGFPKAVNQGINAATGDFICVINNDCVVTPHWWDYIQEHMVNGADLVGPMTNKVSGPQQIHVPIYNDMEELGRVAGVFHAENFHKYMYFYRLVGFCLVFRRSVIDRIGSFDEQFGMGNFEDDDFCLRAVEAGFQLRIAQDIYVHHYGSMTHHAMDVEYDKLLKENMVKFTKKWGKKLEEGLITNKEEGYYEKERRF
uniref:Putative glycosyltransferase n=1 Tax=viral metagenome TaxID=1070528 RepID=A0A6M3M278_9ZZZZ